MNLFNLTGKVAVVTGGNRGIGLGMAEGIASLGANIVIAGRDAEAASVALTALRALGVKAEFVATDVTKKAYCQALIDQAASLFGRVDILVNNSGIVIIKEPQDFTEAEWHHVMDTNLTGAFLCSQAAYHVMKKSGGGKIINIGSMFSILGGGISAAYTSSKGGIMQLTRATSCAWAKENIQVNCVLPGWIDTDMTRGARQQYSGLHESIVNRTPSGRWGVPRDLAGIAAFLASPASDFITGTAIPVDGGYSIGM